MNEEQMTESLAELDGIDPCIFDDGISRFVAVFDPSVPEGFSCSRVPPDLHPEKGYNELHRIINNMSLEVLRSYQRALTLVTADGASTSGVAPLSALQATTLQMAEAILGLPTPHRFSLRVDIDTDDDCRIEYNGKEYCFYGDELVINRSFETLEECANFLTDEIKVLPGMKASQYVEEWIVECATGILSGEYNFYTSGNQVMSIDVEDKGEKE